MIKLSKPSKMPCPSWSLQAIDTCPGSRKANGQLVDACEGCYATDGNYRFSNVKAPRIHNKDDWKRADFVADMVAILDNYRYFRWFDSGDVYHPKLALKILEIMRLTPWCSHWMPTRMHKFPKFRKIFANANNLDNSAVRFSSDSIDGKMITGKNTSTIFPSGFDNLKKSWDSASKSEKDQIIKTIRDNAPKKSSVCEAYTRDGKCGSCRACWDKNISVIAYPAHGRKMAKQYKLIKLSQVA